MITYQLVSKYYRVMEKIITEDSLGAMWLNFNDRIMEICRHYRITKKDIADRIGINPSRMSQRIGCAQHTIAYLILIYYPNIDARWLLFGQGSMVKNDAESPQDNIGSQVVKDEAVANASVEYQTLLDKYTALVIENCILKSKK